MAWNRHSLVYSQRSIICSFAALIEFIEKSFISTNWMHQNPAVLTDSNGALWFRTAWKWDIRSYTNPWAWERVSEWANKRVQWSARAKREVRSKRMSERCERMSERMSEWSSTYVPITGLSESPCGGGRGGRGKDVMRRYRVIQKQGCIHGIRCSEIRR